MPLNKKNKNKQTIYQQKKIKNKNWKEKMNAKVTNEDLNSNISSGLFKFSLAQPKWVGW